MSKVKSHGLLVGNCESPATFVSSTIESSDFLVVNIHPYFGQLRDSQAAQIKYLVLPYQNLKK